MSQSISPSKDPILSIAVHSDVIEFTKTLKLLEFTQRGALSLTLRPFKLTLTAALEAVVDILPIDTRLQ